jgi:hypothetical protein
MDLAAVLSAGAGTAERGLDQGDRKLGSALAQGQSRPKPGEATADDRDIDRDLAGERGRRLFAAFGAECIAEPPGRVTGRDRRISGWLRHG